MAKTDRTKRQASSPPKFFWQVFKRTAHPEDTFTECLAETLRQDSLLSNMLVSHLMGMSEPGHAESVKVAQVRTQVSYPELKSRPDLVLRLAEYGTLAVEIKLDTKLGQDQLDKYLAIPEIDWVAFATGRWGDQKIPSTVLNNPKYLRPTEGTHFLWHDIFPLIEERLKRPSPHLLSAFLLDLFGGLGYRPVIVDDGRWGERCPEAEPYRIKFLEPIEEALADKDWKTEFGQFGREIYAKGPGVGNIKQVYINNFSNPNELKVRFTLPENLQKFSDRVESSSSLPVEHMRIVPYIPKVRPPKHALDFYIAKSALFQNVTSDEERQALMKNYIMNLHKTLEKT